MDLVSIAAFFLGLVASIYSFAGYIRGAVITLFPSEQILIRPHSYGGPEKYVRLGARMAYVNTGQSDRYAIIKREVIRFRLGGAVHEQAWQMFETFDASESGLEVVDRIAAHPEVINGGDAISHETYFAPRSSLKGSFLKWNDFLASLKTANELEFELIGEMYESKPVVAKCTVKISKNLINAIESGREFAPACEATQF